MASSKRSEWGVDLVETIAERGVGLVETGVKGVETVAERGVGVVERGVGLVPAPPGPDSECGIPRHCLR